VGNSVSDVVPKVDPDASTDGRPRGNASREEWVAYALANGKTEDDITGLKQTEIRALFADDTDGEGSSESGEQSPAGDNPPATGGDQPSEE
jgi:hypothetical protein